MSQATALPLFRKVRPDTNVDGRWKAVRRNWFAELNDAVTEFRRLGTPEARAAFADNWIGIWARDFDRAWPMVYELLRLIEEQQLYLNPRRVGPGAPGEHHGDRVYSNFADYFTDRIRQPFQRWAELERTYSYAKTYAPELFEVAFPEAERRVAGAHGGDRRSEAHQVGDSHLVGNTRDRWLARLDRDRPDLAAKVDAGELSAHAAAIEAGFRHRTIAVSAEDPDAAVAALIRKFGRAAIMAAIERQPP